jgi:glycosyltransferase involved in cell wall biosynthesis
MTERQDISRLERWENPPNRLAVIPTHDRPDVLQRCLQAIAPQVDEIIIIDNNTVPGQIDTWPHGPKFGTIVLPVVMSPPNLSKLWNIGLDFAEIAAGPQERDWYVAVLNDDAIAPQGWFDVVINDMARTGAVAGCSGPRAATHRVAEPIDLYTRMTGWAFILKGNEGLRADERFEYWFGDDDLGWQAAERGGMTMVQGFQVENLFPNGSMTPELHARTALDAQAFVDKWGRRPW